MKTIKRHWQVVLAIVAAVVLTGSFALRSRDSAVQAQPGGVVVYEPVSELQRDAISTLLEETSLDYEALFALNPSANQAESLLSAVRTWYEQNSSTLTSLRATIAQKIDALHTLELAIRVGPAEEGQDEALATAQQELATARANYTSALSGLQGDVNELLSESQRATWTAIRGGLGQRMPIRMVSLTSQQRQDLHRAKRHFDWQMGAANTSDAQSAAVSAWSSAIGEILSNDQQTVMTAYESNLASASAAVVDAVAEVLPPSQA